MYIDKYPYGEFRIDAYNLKAEISKTEINKTLENISKIKQAEALDKERRDSISRKQLEEKENKRSSAEPEMVFVEAGVLKQPYEYDEFVEKKEKKGLLGWFSKKTIQKITTTNERTFIVNRFFIGKYPITQLQWKTLMDNNPSYFKGDDLPVEEISWDDCQEFIKRLNELTGKNYRLPNDREWEFAAKGGNDSKAYEFSGSNNANEVAWHSENSYFKTHSVGSKTPNELGIYDMSGNVWEWCFLHDDTNKRVSCGGSWNDDIRDCRTSHHSNNKWRTYDKGFRLLLPI